MPTSGSCIMWCMSVVNRRLLVVVKEAKGREEEVM